MPYLLIAIVCTFLVISIAACDSPDGQPTDQHAEERADPSPQADFWEAMQQHCGNAYDGELITEPPGDDMLAGDERLVVHFRECGDDEMKLPFHIEKPDGWDRSRTWVYTRDEDGLELRHDHRHDDGTPEENTWYGGRTQAEGTSDQQEFIFTERTAEDGSLLGWRIRIIPNERYTYGTFRGDDYTWRVDFDLSQTVDIPPAPWGHE